MPRQELQPRNSKINIAHFLLISLKDLQVHGLCIQGICNFIVSLQRYGNRGVKGRFVCGWKLLTFRVCTSTFLILVLHVLRSEIF